MREQDLLHKNLDAARRRPELAALCALADEPSCLSDIRIVQENDAIRHERNTPDGWVRYGQSGQAAADSPKLIEMFQDAWPGRNGLCVLFGIGLGQVGAMHAHPEIARRCKENNVGLLILEEDPLVLYAACHMMDLSQMFASQRVFWSLESDLRGGWDIARAAHKLDMAPGMGFAYGRPVATQQEHEDRNRIAERIRADGQTRLNALSDAVAALPAESRKRPYDCLDHIQVTLSRDDRAVTFIALGLLEALEAAGHRTTVSWIGSDIYCPLPVGLAHVLPARPDAVLVMNDVPDAVLAQIAEKYHRPRIAWFVDNPRSYLHRGKPSRFGEHDFVVLWDRHHETVLRERGAEWVGHMPYAADRQAQARAQERFRCAVSFVGQVYDRSKSRAFFDDQAWSYLQALAEASMQDPLAAFETLVERVPPPAGMDLEGLCSKVNLPYLVYCEGNARKRLEHLRPLAPLGLHLYGPETWLQFLEDGDSLRDAWKGPIDHHAEFPSLIKSSDINLNIHSLQAITSLNMRDYDVPLQGGFLLTDRVDGAEHSFIPDKEMVFYRGARELCERVEHYLKHPEERAEIVERGRARVLADHTYSARWSGFSPSLYEEIRRRGSEQGRM